PRAIPLLSGLGVALGILTTCAAASWDHDWLAYHVLMAAWCVVGAATLLGTQLSLRRHATPGIAAFPLVAPVVVVGGLVLGLALRGVVEDPLAPWWSAGALLFVAGLAAGLTLWRQREIWAFAGGLLVLLAVSLVVEHIYRGKPFERWWVVLVQANAVAAAL